MWLELYVQTSRPFCRFIFHMGKLRCYRMLGLITAVLFVVKLWLFDEPGSHIILVVFRRRMPSL